VCRGGYRVIEQANHSEEPMVTVVFYATDVNALKRNIVIFEIGLSVTMVCFIIIYLFIYYCKYYYVYQSLWFVLLFIYLFIYYYI
jgi:hypothetical protein